MNISEETDRLASGDFSSIGSQFRLANFDPPFLAWDPKPEDLSLELLRVIYEYWAAMPRCTRGRFAGLPLASELDPLEVHRALGYLMLLDVLEGGEDFRYRVYGSKIADVVGFDSTGLLVSETKPHPITRLLFQAVYRAVMKVGKPIFTKHEPAMNIAVVTWYRLVLPMVDEDGEISQILVGNIPQR